MDVEYPGFGRIVVDGIEYDHDVILESGRVSPRSKGPSKHLKSRYGHTPLSEAEAIPWSGSRLIIGTGYSGALPITPGVHEEAARRGITLEIAPTEEVCALLRTLDAPEANAVLHLTC